MTSQRGSVRKRQANGTRSRSFNGCDMCRTRRLKCDEVKPSCRQCCLSELSCAYSKSLFFGNDAGPSHTNQTARFRRHIFTEDEQQYMSDELVSSLAHKPTLMVLAQLDEECESWMNDRDTSQASRGPFGAFQTSGLPQLGIADKLDVHQTERSDYDAEDIDFCSQLYTAEDLPPVIPSHTTTQLLASGYMNSNLNGYDMYLGMTCDALELPLAGNTDSIIASRLLTDDGDVVPVMNDSTERVPTSTQTMEPMSCDVPGRIISTSQHNDPYMSLCLTDPLFPIDPRHQERLSTAIPLIKHYCAFVIASMTPYSHENTPWHIIFVPQLKTCLATLTLGQSLDDCHLTMLYGALSISALSLGVMHSSQMWMELSATYRKEGAAAVQQLVQRLYLTQGRSSEDVGYKQHLLALLAMAQAAYFAGEQQQTETFLVEAEKLVRMRGLRRKKSRQVRLLHHCYVYMRLFHESTFTSAGVIESTHRRQVRKAIELSDVAHHSTDTLSFRLVEWDDLPEAMKVEKSRVQRENDLHIAMPGRNVSSMYPEIFGVPEEFFFLLSQVIRLGNEKDAAVNNEELTYPVSLNAFTKRAKAIERSIEELALPVVELPQSAETLVMHSMVQGLRCALSIYFYRRIYDISPRILEPQVRFVRDWLLRQDALDTSTYSAFGTGLVLRGALGLLWPAFIAACEAEDVCLQESFAAWFCSAARRSGLRGFQTALEMVRSVWAGREQ